MFQKGQARFQKTCSIYCKIFEVCLTILGRYALKGFKRFPSKKRKMLTVKYRYSRTVNSQVKFIRS